MLHLVQYTHQARPFSWLASRGGMTFAAEAAVWQQRCCGRRLHVLAAYHVDNRGSPLNDTQVAGTPRARLTAC